VPLGHDVHRAVTRFGLTQPDSGPGSADPVGLAVRARGEVDVHRGQRRARAALLLVLGLPGSVYLYQGEELGLPEVLDLPDDARQDPIWVRSGGTEHGRDGCRVPLPWRAQAPAFGFGPGTAATWLPQPDWFAGYAVEDQWARPGSTLRLHAEALRLRRRLTTELDGAELEWLEAPGRPDVLAYRRGRLTVVVVFGSRQFTLPTGWGEVQLASGPVDVDAVLPGESAAWLIG